MAEKKLPAFRGVVQTVVEGGKGSDIGNIAIWHNEGKSENAPVFTGNLTKADGTKFRVALWEGGKKFAKKSESTL